MLEDSLQDLFRTAWTQYPIRGELILRVYFDLVLANKDETQYRIFRGFKPLSCELARKKNGFFFSRLSHPFFLADAPELKDSRGEVAELVEDIDAPMDMVFGVAGLADAGPIVQKVSAAVASGDLFEGPTYDNSE